MKSKTELNESSASNDMLQKFEKERKKTKLAYIISGLVFSVALMAFFMFGPLQIPVLSHMGNSILDLVNNKETAISEDDTNKEEDIVQHDDIVAPEEEVVKGTKTEAEEVSPPTTTTKKPTPTPIPAPVNNDATVLACKSTCDAQATSEMQNNCDATYNSIIQECNAYYSAYILELNQINTNSRNQCFYEHMYDGETEEYNVCLDACAYAYNMAVTEKQTQRASCYSIGDNRKTECAGVVQQKKSICYQICDAS